MAKKPEVSIMKINPRMAEEWLEMNHPDNRFVRQRRIDLYTQQMQEGNWPLSNQVICFDSERHLINGQHTLRAIINSGKTIECIVLENMAPESKMVLDCGANRSTFDHFHMMGRDYSRQAPAVVRRIVNGGKFHYEQGLSDFDIDEFLKKHNKLVEWALFNFRSGGEIGASNASIRAIAIRAVLYGEKKERLEKFAEVLQTGLYDPGDEAAIMLRNWMINNKGYNSGRRDRQRFYGLCETAIKAFIEKKRDLKKLKPTYKELFPLNEDEIDQPFDFQPSVEANGVAEGVNE